MNVGVSTRHSVSGRKGEQNESRGCERERDLTSLEFAFGRCIPNRSCGRTPRCICVYGHGTRCARPCSTSTRCCSHSRPSLPPVVRRDAMRHDRAKLPTIFNRRSRERDDPVFSRAHGSSSSSLGSLAKKTRTHA